MHVKKIVMIVVHVTQYGSTVYIGIAMGICATPTERIQVYTFSFNFFGFQSCVCQKWDNIIAGVHVFHFLLHLVEDMKLNNSNTI